MSLFTGRSFSIGAAAVLAFSATMPPLYLAFTLLVQTGYGASPLTAALDFAPSPWHSRSPHSPLAASPGTVAARSWSPAPGSTSAAPAWPSSSASPRPVTSRQR